MLALPTHFKHTEEVSPEDSPSSFPPPWPSSVLKMRPRGFEKAVTSLVTANKYLK